MKDVDVYFVIFNLLLYHEICQTTRTNIAVGKESRQSSTYNDSTSVFGPQHANDGKTSAHVLTKGDNCSHTEVNTRSYWWAVNLGQKYIIDSISIYNRQDCCGHRLADYYVYVYSPEDATWDNFDAGKGILCYHHNGVSPPVIQIACTREVQGQYVKIFMEHNPRINANTLTLCEVEVYISRDLHRQTSSVTYCKQPNMIPLLPSPLQLNCARICQQTDGCLGFYQTMEGMCKLVDTYDGPNTQPALVYYERC